MIPSNLRRQYGRRWNDESNDLYLSVASIWELTLKRVPGKLHLNEHLRPPWRLSTSSWFPSVPSILRRLSPCLRFYKDPFDRLLLAQARVEDLVLVTQNEILARYGVPVWLI